MIDTIGILIVEDHPTFRLGLKSRLDLEDDLEVVGEVGSAEAALDLTSPQARLASFRRAAPEDEANRPVSDLLRRGTPRVLRLVC